MSPSLLPLLVGCAPGPALTPAPDSLWGTTDAGAAALSAAACTLDPPLGAETLSLRVDPDGVLWNLDLDGRVTRYAARDGDDCLLDGETVFGAGEFDAVQDLELDADGRPVLLVFFDAVVRLDADGAVALECPVPAAHALAPDGERVHTWPIGAASVDVTPFGEACGASEPLALAQALGTSAAVGPAGLAAATFDPTGELPPGVVLDLTDGAHLGDLAPGGAVTAIGDLVVDGDGWLVTDLVDGGLFRLAANGAMVVRYDPDTLPGAQGRSFGFSAVAYRAGLSAYVAAWDLDGAAIWRVEGL